MDVGRVVRIAVGVGAGIGGIALLAACGNEPEAPAAPTSEPDAGGPRPEPNPVRPVRPPAQMSTLEFLHRRYDAFDATRPDGIRQPETTRTRSFAITGQRNYTHTDANGGRHWTQRTGRQRETLSMANAWGAAAKLQTKDATASWSELKLLAGRFDKDGHAGLSSREQTAFERAFPIRVTARENIWTGVETGVVRPPRDPYPGPGNGGHTSPGDDHGGGHTSPGDDHGGTTSPGDDWGSGGTSHGDDGGNSGGSGGTSGGDDGGWGGSGGSGGTSGGDDGGWGGSNGSGGTSGGDYGGSSSGGSSSSGNSSDNGNPNWDDF